MRFLCSIVKVCLGTDHVLVVGMVGVHVSLQELGGGEGLATVAGEVGWRMDGSDPADWRTVGQP